MMKMRVLLLLAIAATVAVSCRKKDVQWESDWAVPLINDTLSLQNWVNDSTLGVNGGYYELQLRRLLFDLNINDLVEIPDTTIEKDYYFGFTSFIANPGFTFVSSTEEHSILIPDVELKKVTLKSGYIDVEVHNVVPTTAIFNVKLPGAKLNGVYFDETYSAPPGTNANPGVVKKTINLANYTLDLTGLSGAASNRLLSQIKASTSTTGPTVTITNQDVTKVKATFRDIEVSYAKGYFGNQVIEETDTFELKPLNAYQSGLLDLGSTDIKFTIENGIKVAANAKLFEMTSTNNLGTSVDLTHPMLNAAVVVNPASGFWNTLTPSTTVIEANSSNSNIENYIEHMGNKHRVKYRLELNPWGNVSGSTDEYFPNSRFRIYVDASMPLSIGMDELVLQDTFDLNLDQTESNFQIQSGDLIINTTNAFPLSADLEVFLLNESNANLYQISASEKVQSGLFGNVPNSYGLPAANSTIRFTLTEEMLSDLPICKKVVVRAKLNTLDPVTSTSQQVQIPEHAFMSIKMRSEFKSKNTL